MAPCQMTANTSALMIYGSRSVNKGVSWSHILLFLFGKMIVFSSLGFIVWVLGNEMQQMLIGLFPWARKLTGPLLIVVGFVLLEVIKLKKTIQLGNIPEKFIKGTLGSFLMGISFSFGFCPTMFVLFFVTLMPMALSEPIGFILPSIFALGTTLPIIFIIWYLELDKKAMKKSREIGSVVKRITGVILIMIGSIDTIYYL
ncbi:sulfite exporter TauE/SafE family protein [Metabacillus idriensis]|uniref:urease accessory protein UreH domain-containing protein n=1 Tax=Metabacillus idriensis TaxID=324768 RepID=UPI00203D8888|nr:sulfite exporter TauE/SafE family protein [Metabacillus idriensis]MCM3597975.1 sulfite exporter TauE/SafE family protein [Metabacillus idriensis]